MGLLDSIKGYFNAFDEEEESEEEVLEQSEDSYDFKKETRREEPKKAESPRVMNGKSN